MQIKKLSYMQDYICKKDKIKKKYFNQFIFKNR